MNDLTDNIDDIISTAVQRDESKKKSMTKYRNNSFKKNNKNTKVDINIKKHHREENSSSIMRQRSKSSKKILSPKEILKEKVNDYFKSPYLIPIRQRKLAQEILPFNLNSPQIIPMKEKNLLIINEEIHDQLKGKSNNSDIDKNENVEHHSKKKKKQHEQTNKKLRSSLNVSKKYSLNKSPSMPQFKIEDAFQIQLLGVNKPQKENREDKGVQIKDNPSFGNNINSQKCNNNNISIIRVSNPSCNKTINNIRGSKENKTHNIDIAEQLNKISEERPETKRTNVNLAIGKRKERRKKYIFCCLPSKLY